MTVRRANQLQNLQDSAQSHQDQVAQLEQEKGAIKQRAKRREDLLLSWIRELEAIAKQSTTGESVTEIRQRYEESLQVEGDFRVRQGRTSNDDSNCSSQSGALVLASPAQRDWSLTGMSQQGDQFGGQARVRSPVSIQALLDPVQDTGGSGGPMWMSQGQVMADGEGVQSGSMNEYSIIEGMPIFRPGGELGFGVFDPAADLSQTLQEFWNSGFGMQPSFFPAASTSSLEDMDSQLNSLTPPVEQVEQRDGGVYTLEPRSLMNLTLQQVEEMTDSTALQMARSLILQTQPPDAYTPTQDRHLTSSADELSSSVVAARRFREYAKKTGLATPPPTSLGEISLPDRPDWRKSYTPAQVYLLFRALMESHPAGSKAYYDGKTAAELTGDRKLIYERWQAYEGKDMRVHLVPAMILRLRVIMCDELADKGDLDLASFMEDILHEAM